MIHGLYRSLLPGMQGTLDYGQAALRNQPQTVRGPYMSLRVAKVEASTVQSRVPGLLTIGPTTIDSVSAKIRE